MHRPKLLLFVALLSAALPAWAGSIENTRTAKRVFLEGMATGNLEPLRDLYAPDFVGHAAVWKYTAQQDMDSTASWHTAMPDLTVTVERTVADRDSVALHWRAVGTNSVATAGLPGRGERIGVEGMTIFRFSSGHIAEEWSVVDVAPIAKLLER
jgi:steroid delta-isomerase-like uncharacterized protein